MTDRASRLRAIKVLHTIAWAWFAGCIAALPVAALARRFDVAFVLIGIVAVEVLILAFNQWHCPLTPWAARYTEERHSNFDIYLPEWLARYNKQVFGSLYLIGIVLTLALWSGLLG